jgi:hypothetical protein
LERCSSQIKLKPVLLHCFCAMLMIFVSLFIFLPQDKTDHLSPNVFAWTKIAAGLQYASMMLSMFDKKKKTTKQYSKLMPVRLLVRLNMKT